jgi:hypothetical protein
MSFLIVNTPFARNFVAAACLHFFSTRGILLHPRMAGNYPRIPGIALGLGLVHYLLLSATHRLSLLVPLRRSAPSSWQNRDEATGNMSQFRWRYARPRRTLLQRPAGLMFTVDDPMRRSHHPRACARSYQQRYEVIYDSPMQFAFASPLRLPTRDAESLLFGHSRFVVGFPLCSRPRVGHSGEERFGHGCGPRPTIVPSAS